MEFLRDIVVLVQNDKALDYCALQIANLCAHGHPCEDLWCPTGISGNIVPGLFGVYRYPAWQLLVHGNLTLSSGNLPWSKLQKAGDMTFRGAYNAVHRYCAPTTGVL